MILKAIQNQIERFLVGRVRPDPCHPLYTPSDLQGFSANSNEIEARENVPGCEALRLVGKYVFSTNCRIFISVLKIECRSDVVRQSDPENSSGWMAGALAVFSGLKHARQEEDGFSVKELPGSDLAEPCECVSSLLRDCPDCRGTGIRHRLFEFDGRKFDPSYRGILEKVGACLLPRVNPDLDLLDGKVLPTYFHVYGGFGAISPMMKNPEFAP